MNTDEAQRLIRLKRSELEKVIRRSKNLSAAERLGIYANAYYSRLMECLRESFPVLAKTLGREVFDGFAFEYLQRYPSKSYTLNRLGDHFSRFLEETRPTEDGDWADFLIDLSRLEWSIEQVFDGPGVEGQLLLSARHMQLLDAARFGQMRLKPVVCLRLLQFKYPVNDYYTGARRAKDNEEIPEPPAANEQFLALTRRDFIVRRIELSAAQHALLAALQTGRTVEEAIAAAVETESDIENIAASLREWFMNWTTLGLFDRVGSA